MPGSGFARRPRMTQDDKTVIAITSQTPYSHPMIRSKTLRAAAKLLLGTFIAAYAMVSLHVSAKTAPSAPSSAAATAENIVSAAAEAPCHETPAPLDTALLLCKFHCQSVMQTLDHPDASLHSLPATAALMIPLADLTKPLKPLVDKAFRPDATHHGGAPPLYASTARLRI